MDPYIGDIRIFGGNFAPVGWLPCDGSLRLISDYQLLYQLIGTTYGGDGVTTFATPNMCSRVAVGQGQGPGLSNYTMGQFQGAENVPLSGNQMPAHQHPVTGAVQALAGAISPTASPESTYFADKGQSSYQGQPGKGALAETALTGTMDPTGGSQFHPNVQPVTAIYYIISALGQYPSQPS